LSPAAQLLTGLCAAWVEVPDVVKDGSSVCWWSMAVLTASEQALWKAD